MASVAQLDFAEEYTPTPVFDLPPPQPGAGINRRFLPRLSRTFRVCPTDGASQFEGLDLSFGGLMCTGQELVWPGNAVEMDLHLPGERLPVRVTGRVAEIVSHRGRTAMRVRFEQVGDAKRKRIALWMSRQV